MDLNRLAVFAAVAEVASFSGAADKLGMPKSSVSREIARLEEDLGVLLLHRTTRKVALSTAGAELFERISPLLAGLEKAAALPERADEPSGMLRITATSDIGTAILGELIARYRLRYPEVRVDVLLTNRVVDLVAEGVDVALRVSAQGQLRDSDLTARRLGPFAVGMYGAPRYLARRGSPKAVEDLADHDLVTLRGGPNLPGAPEPKVSCDDMVFLREVLRSEAGIGILPTFLADPYVESGELVRVLPTWATWTGTIWLVYPGGNAAPPKVTAFRDLVADALRRKPLAPEPA